MKTNMLVVLFGGMALALFLVVVWAGVLEVPLAAIPPSQTLPDITTSQSKSYSITVALSSTSKAISNLWYRLEFYEAGTDTHIHYPSSGFVNTGTAIASGDSHTFTTPGTFGSGTAGKYAVLIYVSDGNDNPDTTKWEGMQRSAYSTAFFTACSSTPTGYGCTAANKATCCKGSGYWQTVVPAVTCTNTYNCPSGSTGNLYYGSTASGCTNALSDTCTSSEQCISGYSICQPISLPNYVGSITIS